MPSSPLSACPPSTAPASGITVLQLHAAFPGTPMRRVEAAEFRRFASLHAGRGRLLTGPGLASALGAAAAPLPLAASRPRPAQASPAASRRHPSPATVPPDSLPAPCRALDSLKRRACRDSLFTRDMQRAFDSLAAVSASRSGNSGEEPEDQGNVKDTMAGVSADSLILGRPDRAAAESDETEVYQERSRGYFLNFIYDARHGGWDWDAGDWAMVVYVVVGVVVVGAFVLYGVQAVYDQIVNTDKHPVFREIGLRYSYSGKAWEDGGPRLYRDASLFGVRFSMGLDRGPVGLGLTAEGGYIDLALRGVDDPSRGFDFQGGYLVAGPLVRFGDCRPLSFSLEFLNGTSDHRSIGWISKSRMTLQTHLGHGALLGAHLGAVFYDLRFFDGLVARRGDFNRDLSLVMGLEAGWAF